MHQHNSTQYSDAEIVFLNIPLPPDQSLGLETQYSDGPRNVGKTSDIIETGRETWQNGRVGGGAPGVPAPFESTVKWFEGS